MPKLYALLVGINNYHPKSSVTSLSGCVSDVAAVEALLLDKYRDLNPEIVVLKNDEATRKAVIETFRNHIAEKAKPNDTAIFFYAGHGSYCKSAAVFAQYDGIVQDETFVCYDSRVPGQYDLTDKEMAVLLSEVTKGVHMVVIADSCHSASITRSGDPHRVAKIDHAASAILGKKRFTKGNTKERPLTSYMLSEDNYYVRQKDNITIPRSKHLLFSACSRNEEAWETTSKRGLFTTTLLNVLGQNANISYADLFARVRTLVYNKAKNQQPCFYPYEGFDPNVVFLKSDKQVNRRRFEIQQDETSGRWVIDFGAIHGLPGAKKDIEQIVVGVYADLEDDSDMLTSVGLSSVQLSNATLKEVSLLQDGQLYWGEIQSLPASLLVNLVGSKPDIQTFQSLLSSKYLAQIELVTDFPQSKYTVKIADSGISIVITKSNRVVAEEAALDGNSVGVISDKLMHIGEWERILQLENSESGIRSAIEYKFLEEVGREEFKEYTDDHVTLDYFKKGEDKTSTGKSKPIWYQIHIRNNSSGDLYVSLLNVNSNFGVTSHFPCEVIPAKSDWKIIDDQHGITLDDDEASTQEVFKLIISTQYFNDYKYQLKEITRGTVTRDEYEEVEKEGDWYVETIRVTTVRTQDSLGDQDRKIGDLTVGGHADFKADLAFATTATGSRGNSSIGVIAALNDIPGMEVLSVGGQKSRGDGGDQSIIELSNIENIASLSKNPLVFNYEKTLPQGDYVVPVTVKDGFVIPFGASTREENGNFEISINDFPEGSDELFPSKGKRGLGRALWFSLLKIGGYEKNAFLLRMVIYEDGKATRVPITESQVQDANNVLVVIHGIIGDTKSIIKNLEFLLTTKRYDLILTFDYENLNTTIEESAEEFSRLLGKVGLAPDCGKVIDILAHSMGGLVSRYLIESVHKEATLINQLYMVGTPNGGSVFGDIPAYRDRLLRILTVGINFAATWLGPAVATLNVVTGVLKGTEALTKTLAQMSSDSDFIKEMNREVVRNAAYTIIAGDITSYVQDKESRIGRLMEGAILKIGNTANDGAPNDIAVLVKDIKGVPTHQDDVIHDIRCHHMNYFEEGPGLDLLRDILIKDHT